jgi:hypothetical protein
MLLKQQLVAEHPGPEAFEAFRNTFGWPHWIDLETLRLEDQLEFAKRCGTFFSEIAPAGVPFAHEPPRVVGEGLVRRVEGVSRSQYVACIGPAVLRGRSTLKRVGDALLIDRQAGEYGRMDDEIEWDPVVFAGSQDEVQYITAADQDDLLEIDEAFSLLGCQTDFFGDWLCKYLGQYIAAEISGFLPEVPVLIDSWMPPSHREALEMFSRDGTRIIEVDAFRSVRVRRLWIAPTLLYMPVHEMQTARFSWAAVTAPAGRFAPVLARMASQAGQKLGPARRRARRVFFARKHFRHRKLVNYAEIAALAMSRGFDVVFPEDHTFAQQVNFVREAEFLVAPEGSAIYLAYVASAGTKLCILSHPWIDALAEYNATLATRGVDVSAVTGPVRTANAVTPHDSDYEIDPERFEAFLDGWLACARDRE